MDGSLDEKRQQILHLRAEMLALENQMTPDRSRS